MSESMSVQIPSYEDVLALEIEFEQLDHYLEDDPSRVYDEKVETALASSYDDGQLWAKFEGKWLTNGGPELPDVGYNSYVGRISGLSEEMEADEEGDKGETRGPPDIPEPDEPTYWDTVRECVLRNYDQEMLDVVEALCANATVLTLENIDNAPMLFAEGASGAGKSTAISFTEGASDELIIRSDDVTPAAFNSHSTDQEDEGENDLIPEIKHRVLSTSELSKLFSGDPDKIKEFWSTLASVGDGDGYIKSTGAQGRRGYEGDFMFAFQGATTPLGPVAWNAMGTIGGRVLFHEVVGEYGEASIRDSYWEHEKEPSQRKAECKRVVSEFLRTMWHEETDGYGSVEWRDHDGWEPDESVKNAITKFAHLISLARTPMNRDNETGEWQAKTPEVYHRLVDQLVQLSRARSMIHGRRRVEMEDVGLVARVAMSSMPKKRRPFVRWLMDPETAPDRTSEPGGFGEGKTRVREVTDYTGKSRDTVIRHLKILDTLDLLTLKDIGEGNDTEWLVSKNVSGDREWSAGENTRFDRIWDLGVPFPDAYFIERE